jgi:hypothetical protein
MSDKSTPEGYRMLKSVPQELQAVFPFLIRFPQTAHARLFIRKLNHPRTRNGMAISQKKANKKTNPQKLNPSSPKAKTKDNKNVTKE